MWISKLCNQLFLGVMVLVLVFYIDHVGVIDDDDNDNDDDGSTIISRSAI